MQIPAPESSMSHRIDEDPRVAALEDRLRQAEYERMKEREKMGISVIPMKQPRFGRIQKQERTLFVQLPKILQLVIAKSVVRNTPIQGVAIPGDAWEPERQFTTIASHILIPESGGDVRVVIHEWAIDLDPPAGCRASWSFNKATDLIAHASDPANWDIWQGDIVTFVRVKNLRAKCEKFLDDLEAIMKGGK